MIPRRSSILLAGASLLAAPGVLRAQGARRPLRVVVPFPPGGGVDSLGRVLADRLPAVLDQPVVVDNRSGAGGLIGADAVAKGPPDGTMIGIIGAATICAAPFLQSSMPFDPVRDLRPVTQITDASVLLVVNAQRANERGWTDLRSTLAWARANPGAMRLAHSGVATVSHLTLAALESASGAPITQVPYRGGAQATTDAVAGVLDGAADLPTALIPHVEAGRLRALGVSSKRRFGLLPDVPSFAEYADLGLGDIDIRSWNAMMVPAATPEAEVRRLFAGIRQVATQPSFRDALRPLGYDPAPSDSPMALAAMIASETPRWRRLVEVSGARVE
ncbi:tripartite tricarboxylate transporter substrate binding protein [Roseomonas sp. JC162]|uniref:Tripartite tricarboxylate transporter substrate binding protein n=1 Tax=Neoroseomonas marina TaxID=1232220 RepID=A0A848EHD1_9PROT|nr:tripartite tricarboxylate transporter substrate binding protein [Neoroseomonas marina]NMJ44054.1 tripartite tricarboxylate transporter substrate binding protein [Neoroseomonas marina]